VWLPPLVAALLAPAFAVKVKDSDVWWHMATGRWIAEHRRLPTTDPFTYTVPGKRWHLVNGIADLLLYGFYRVGAETGLVIAKVLFAWLTLTLIGLCLRLLRCSRITIVALLISTALLVQGRYTQERPMIMGAVLLAACSLFALRSHERQDRSHLFFLVALPLWPLVHGTALLGLAQLGSLLVAGLVARAPRRHLISVGATFAACVALTLVLPWWRDLYYVGSSLGRGATATTFTAEWSTGLEALPNRVGHWMVIAGGIVGGLLRVRRNALLLLFSLTGAAIAARFGRNAYEAVLLATPAFGCAVEELSARVRAAGSRLYAAMAAPIAALAVGSIQLALAPFATIGGPFGFGVVRANFPYDTLETLRRLPVHRLINDFPIGGFLIWENGPWGVYCDGRTVALYDEEDVKNLIVPLFESAEALTASADRWDAPYGLTGNLSPPNQWMMVSPEWTPLHLGLGTSLFIRSSHLAEVPPGIMPLHFLRYTEEERWMNGYYRGILESPSRRAELVRETAEAARMSPWSPLLADIVVSVQRLDGPFGNELAAVVDRARSEL
jgi:hypothetical protein